MAASLDDFGDGASIGRQGCLALPVVNPATVRQWMPSGQTGTILGNDVSTQIKQMTNKLYTGTLSNHAIQATSTHSGTIDLEFILLWYTYKLTLHDR